MDDGLIGFGFVAVVVPESAASGAFESIWRGGDATAPPLDGAACAALLPRAPAAPPVSSGPVAASSRHDIESV